MKIAGFSVHPLAELFPLMEGEAFELLVADIEQNGLRVPLDLVDNKIVDGRNRGRACERLKIKPKTRKLPKGTDPLAYVISQNLARRHLSESQRAMAAARIATLKQGRPPKKAEKSALSQREAADAFRVDRRSIQHARKVIDDATPELVAAVDAGAISVSAAASAVDLTKAQQRKLAKASAEGGKAAAQTLRNLRRDQREKELAKSSKALPKGKYTVILADPPWEYDDRRPNMDSDYPKMSLQEICDLPVPSLAAKNCVLFLWVTAPFALDAGRVLDAWGFTYKSQWVWPKRQKLLKSSGKLIAYQGTGYWAEIRHELVYMAVRGNPPPPRIEARFPSLLEDEVVREHSRKPDESYERIETMYPKARRIELFGRDLGDGNRDGWVVWGNQA